MVEVRNSIVNVPRSFRLVLLAFLLCGLLVSCLTKEPTPTTPTPTPQPEVAPTSTPDIVDEIVVLFADEVRTLEPYRMVNVRPESSLAGHIWDTLTFIDDELEVKPGLATSWRLINNFTWEFTLREGVTFHNGEPFNADAVRFSLERAQRMPGSLEVLAQETQLEQVEVLGEHKLRLVTGSPVANLAFLVASVEILPPVYYGETEASVLARAPVGSGPYQVKEWTLGEPVVLEATPDYWNERPLWPRVVFQTEPDPQARLQALRDGTAALVTDLPAMLPEEWDIPESTLASMESTQRMFVGVNIEPDSPLADARVRQALNYGTNVAQITDTWLKGYGQRYGSWVNPPGDNAQLLPYPYDPEKAKALLTEAGYPDGFVTKLHTPSSIYPEDVAIATELASQWRELGITVEVQVVEWELYVAALLSESPPPLFLLGINSQADALQDTRNLSADFAFNPTRWHDPGFEDAVRRARNSFNDNARSRLLYDAQAIAYDECPWIWLWKRYDFYGMSQLLDWSPRADGRVYLYQH
jgi:peptide/nickel transport system substrate-binding protein